MVTRQWFEHQKDINQEAYVLWLVQRVDINFRIDYKWWILDSVSQLPTSWNQVNDAFFVRDNINNRVYIWDGAAWLVDQASTWPSGWVEYTTNPTTIGNRIVQSIGVNADLIEETLIEVDPVTGDILFPDTIEVTFESDVNNVWNTITNDWTTTNNINGAEENWDNTTVINNNGGTINNTGTTINNDWVTENYTNGSTVNYDNTTNVNFDGTVTISGGSLIVNSTTDKANQVYNGSDLTWVLPSTPLTEDALHITTDSGTNLILWVDYSVSGDTITWINNPTNGEWLYARWLVGQANTVPGGQAYYEEFVVWPGGEDTFALNDVPAGANWIFVSTRSGLYGKQGLTRDFTYDAVNNEIVFNAVLDENDVVSVQYIGFVAMPVTAPELLDVVLFTRATDAVTWTQTVSFSGWRVPKYIKFEATVNWWWASRWELSQSNWMSYWVWLWSNKCISTIYDWTVNTWTTSDSSNCILLRDDWGPSRWQSAVVSGYTTSDFELTRTRIWTSVSWQAECIAYIYW